MPVVDDCLACDGACCACFEWLQVAPAEVTAIAAARGTTPDELLDRYQWAEGTAQRPGEPERYTLLLNMRPRCPFQNDAGRCTIHVVRPKACRDFAAGSQQCHAVQEGGRRQ